MYDNKDSTSPGMRCYTLPYESWRFWNAGDLDSIHDKLILCSSFYHPTVLTVVLMLQCCVRLSSVCRLDPCLSVTYILWLEQKLLLTAVYEESIGTKMNDLDLA